jgi:tryptophan synthase beta chain
VPQAYYNKQAGFSRLTTETGAGQWGSSLAFAGQMFGIEVRIYMVKVSYEQKPYPPLDDADLGRQGLPQPDRHDRTGRDRWPRIRTTRAAGPGDLGSRRGSRFPCRHQLLARLGAQPRLLHQTVIGQEAKKQLAKIGEYPDMVFAPCGGGSNFAGIAFPFLADKAAGKKVRLVAVEPTSCPS